jgi:hypothetical protein
MPQREACKTRKPYPVRFDPEDLSQIRLLAEAAGLPVGTYIRKCALESQLPISPRGLYLQRQRQITELHRLGVHQKSLFTESGREQRLPDRAALAAVLGEIRMVLERIE